MELVITAFYIWFIWLIWYKFKWLRPNIVWKVVWPSMWVAVISLELISLGQFCPYSEKSFITTYIYQMAPEYGGMVKEVYAKPNTPIKKSDKLYQMDQTQWQAELKQFKQAARTNAVSKLAVEEAQGKVDSQTADLHRAEASKAETQAQLTQLKVGTIPEAEANREQADLAYNSKINGEFTGVAQAQADLDKYQYILDSTTIVAPTDGYVVDMMLQPGVEIRMDS